MVDAGSIKIFYDYFARVDAVAVLLPQRFHDALAGCMAPDGGIYIVNCARVEYGFFWYLVVVSSKDFNVQGPGELCFIGFMLIGNRMIFATGTFVMRDHGSYEIDTNNSGEFEACIEKGTIFVVLSFGRSDAGPRVRPEGSPSSSTYASWSVGAAARPSSSRAVASSPSPRGFSTR